MLFKDDADMLRKIEARNELEGFIYRALEAARDSSNTEMENACRETRDWLEEHDDASIRDINDKKRDLERKARSTQ